MSRKKKQSAAEVFRETLQMIAPGTSFREAISAIIQSRTGALLCFGDPKMLSELSEGGVKLDADVTPQLLYELSKMDGAIILNENGSKILYANRFLKPDAKIRSDETGTRHRAAHRLAAQAKCVVITISERRSSVTLYVHNRRHLLDSIPALINKAVQAIQTLEKYLAVMQQAMQELTAREFQDVVTIFDVCKAIQRTQMVDRIAQEIEPYILELGSEGRLIGMQLQELVMPIAEANLVLKDYYREKEGLTCGEVQARINDLSETELLNLSSISQALGYGANVRSIDAYLSPRGYRVLHATHRLPGQIIENLAGKFGSLQHIIRAPKDELVQVDGIGEILAERIRISLNLLRNQLALDDRR